MSTVELLLAVLCPSVTAVVFMGSVVRLGGRGEMGSLYVAGLRGAVVRRLVLSLTAPGFRGKVLLGGDLLDLSGFESLNGSGGGAMCPRDRMGMRYF